MKNKLFIILVALIASMNSFAQNDNSINFKAKTIWESQGSMPDAFGFIDSKADHAYYLVAIANKGKNTGILSFRNERTVGKAFGLAWMRTIAKTENFKLLGKVQGTYFSDNEKLSWLKANITATYDKTTFKSSLRRNNNDFTIFELGAEQKFPLWKSAAITSGGFYRSVNDIDFYVPFLNIQQNWKNISIGIINQYQYNENTDKGNFYVMGMISFSLK